MPASSSPVAVPSRSRGRLGGRTVALGAVALGAVGLLLLLAFAGSPATLAEGVRIAGVDVGGLTPSEARRLLEQRSESFARRPVTFVSGSRRWELTPAQLGVGVDWAAAVAAAERQGEGFGPLRGLRRLHARVFGADVVPPTRVSGGALDFAVATIARDVERRPRDAAVVLRGLQPRLVPAATGSSLERRAAETVIVHALAGFSRAPTGLPVRITPPRTTAAELQPALRQARVALSAPIRLDLEGNVWRVPRWRIAELLSLPHDGATTLAIGGKAAEEYLERIAGLVGNPARDAGFVATADGTVAVSPAAPGRGLDRIATAEAILAAATSRTNRLAEAQIRTTQPDLTTAEAGALGISRVLSTYSTAYAGTADRIHNLQLAVSLLDGARVAPGATFSFNDRVGERTEERGFRLAPVIIEGKYEDGVGGGVSQVATTVFNAAWEAGLRIVERAPHALYIARYPLGRDATVNYPDLDLKFLNDTDKWIVLRAVSLADGIAISLYGSPTGRRVVSEAGPLVEKGPPPIKREPDPTMTVGTSVVEEYGQPPRAVSVERTVYAEDGSVLYDETWSTSYRGEPKVVRVGTKPKPKPPEPPKKKQPPAETEPPPTTPPPTTPTVPEPPAP